MKKEELLAQIDQWRKNMEHQKIIDAITALPETERDYVLTCTLAREYNVVNRFAEAKELLESVKKEGKGDPNWYFHYAYTLFSLNRFAEAKQAMQQVLKMVPGNKNAMLLLKSIDVRLDKEEAQKKFGNGLPVDEEKALDYVLNVHLHNNFEVVDKLEEDHIVIPSWNIRIYPEITDIKEDSVIVTFNVENPDWDRDIVEVSAAKGQTPAAALNVACSSFMLSLMNTISLLAKNQNPVRLESEFVGQKHQWSVYRGNILAGGDAQNVENFNVYWDALKDHLAKRIGNQKICYVKVYAMKNGDQVKGECRINDVRIESLSRIVAEIARKWGFSGYGIQRQFFIFKQDAETTQPYPFDQETLEDDTREAVRLFHGVKSKEDHEALPGKLLELANGDATLAKELLLYLPMVSAENAFRKLAYPETLTFEYKDRKVTVYRSQLASFHTIAKALFWALQYKVFGEETERMYQELVAASPLYHFVQNSAKQGNPIKDGMGVALTISVDDDFQIR